MRVGGGNVHATQQVGSLPSIDSGFEASAHLLMLHSLERFSHWKANYPDGIAIFCSHRTHLPYRRAIYRALRPWTVGVHIYALEPSKAHPIHVSDRQVKRTLEQLIARADVFYAVATLASLRSDFIGWEVATAKAANIPVLPVQFPGQHRLPSELIDLCGRNAIPTALLRQRTLEALPNVAQTRFAEFWREHQIAIHCRSN